LGLESGRISIGSPADIILFDADAPFVLDRTTLKSKSKNTPFDGQRMQGKVLKTFVSGQEVFSA
jgi:dihydroorotase